MSHEMPPPDRDAVVKAFTKYLKGRADEGVLLGKVVSSVALDDGGTLRVVFDPSKAGASIEAFRSVVPFDNLAEFVGVPMAAANKKGRRLRSVVQRVETFLVDETDLGAMTKEEIYRAGTGLPLPADD